MPNIYTPIYKNKTGRPCARGLPARIFKSPREKGLGGKGGHKIRAYFAGDAGRGRTQGSPLHYLSRRIEGKREFRSK